MVFGNRNRSKLIFEVWIGLTNTATATINPPLTRDSHNDQASCKRICRRPFLTQTGDEIVHLIGTMPFVETSLPFKSSDIMRVVGGNLMIYLVVPSSPHLICPHRYHG